jgi:hypothetical protein
MGKVLGAKGSVLGKEIAADTKNRELTPARGKTKR